MSIKNNFKECCQECINRESYLNENAPQVMYGCGESIVTVGVRTTIGCVHERVCGTYLSSDINRPFTITGDYEHINSLYDTISYHFLMSASLSVCTYFDIVGLGCAIKSGDRKIGWSSVNLFQCRESAERPGVYELIVLSEPKQLNLTEEEK